MRKVSIIFFVVFIILLLTSMFLPFPPVTTAIIRFAIFAYPIMVLFRFAFLLGKGRVIKALVIYSPTLLLCGANLVNAITYYAENSNIAQGAEHAPLFSPMIFLYP